MYNRKFDIKRDFAHLNELENRIIPIIRGVEREADRVNLEAYVRRIFNNQYKQ